MKLLEIVAVYPPYRGGIGTVARDNAKMAAESGCTVIVCTPRYTDRKLSSQVVDTGVVIQQLRSIFSYGNAAILPGVISEVRKSDIVHLHYPFLGTDIIVALACRIYRKKLYITYHMDLADKGLVRWIFSLYNKLFLPFIVACAYHIFVTSKDYALKSRIRNMIKKKSDRISVLPCTVDTKRFIPREKNKEILSRHGIAIGDPTILFVGGLDGAHYFKGVDLLLDAFASCAADIPRCHLIIVGEGNLRGLYERHAAHLQCVKRIHFAGSVSDEELPLYYSSADACALPSLDESEAFGIALIEAMASGIPVIASRIRGVRSIVRDHLDGILVAQGSKEELADAFRILFHDAEKRAAMGISARNRAEEEYSYKKVKEQFISKLTTDSQQLTTENREPRTDNYFP